MFKSAGFDKVESKLNLTVGELRKTLRDFGNTSRDADVAVVYYAGHGIELDGTNYLIPVDATLETNADVLELRRGGAHQGGRGAQPVCRPGARGHRPIAFLVRRADDDGRCAEMSYGEHIFEITSHSSRQGCTPGATADKKGRA